MGELLDAKMLAKLVSDLDKYIRMGNKELALATLGMLRDGLGNRIAQDSMQANLKAYEAAQARMSLPKAQPAAIGGFEMIDISNEVIAVIEKPKRKRRTKVEIQNEQK